MKKQTLAKGVSTGLQLWLLFLLGLFLLGYAALTSIWLGAIGGFAGGIIANWLQSKDPDPQPVVVDTDIQVPEGEVYQPSLLKKYALKRQQRKEWLKKWKNWTSFKDLKSWRKSS